MTEYHNKPFVLTTANVQDVMIALYCSEINCGIQSFWDGGWTVWLGDDMNGRVCEESDMKMSELPSWLHRKACEHYPHSVYAEASRGKNG